MPKIITYDGKAVAVIEMLPRSPLDLGDILQTLSPDAHADTIEVDEATLAKLREGGELPIEKYVVEICFDDHTSYYEITPDDLDLVMEIEDLNQRFDALLDKGTATKVGGDSDVDLTIVNDGWQDKTECWRDFEEQLDELEG